MSDDRIFIFPFKCTKDLDPLSELNNWNRDGRERECVSERENVNRESDRNGKKESGSERECDWSKECVSERESDWNKENDNPCILRGMICRKGKLSHPAVSIFCDNQKISAEIFYWAPVVCDDDPLRTGIKLVNEGI